MNESSIIDKRYEIVLLFDVIHGNPNGDPDAGNAPRVDPETGYGIVTDVCLKRKVRNFVGLTKQFQPPYDIYVKERGILAREQKRAYEAKGAEPDPGGRANEQARAWMCETFFDVRTFGAVMTTGKTGEDEPANGAKSKGGKKNQKLWNCGQVRGPVQFGFSRSQSPILSLEHTITRVALTNPGDTDRAAAEGSEGEEKAGSGQMGRKYAIPYALYRAHGFVSPFLAADTGFSAGRFRCSAAGSRTPVRSGPFRRAGGDGGSRDCTFSSMRVPWGTRRPISFSIWCALQVRRCPVPLAITQVTLPSEAELPAGVKLRQVV